MFMIYFNIAENTVVEKNRVLKQFPTSSPSLHKLGCYTFAVGIFQ